MCYYLIHIVHTYTMYSVAKTSNSTAQGPLPHLFRQLKKEKSVVFLLVFDDET